ncbi:MAG: type II toxin-antitoxin system HicB family antitoxin [Holophagales bacterium]|nr:type II toxin-antitoxin system HicB family antitoxin [Holophagales bacterium]MYF96215.1 type II toxin-antitoxin system HicB family antitoxin [Holophagales bacterium]
MKYTIVIEKTPNNYAAYAPDLPGCGTTGPTRDEVIRLMQEAIEFHLEGLRRDGEPVPPPQTTAAQVDVAA